MNHSPSVPPSLSAMPLILRTDVEHAVKRRIELAAHVADDIDHRQQILVIDGFFARLSRTSTSSETGTSWPSRERTRSFSRASSWTASRPAG
jgi:hypothetical protein